MNDNRRKVLRQIIEDLSSIRSRLEEVQSDEQDAYDNMPESLQQSERGEKAEQACSLLDDAMSYLGDLESAIEEAAA